MIVTTLAQATWDQLAYAASISAHSAVNNVHFAPEPKQINTDGVLTFLATKIAPILLAVLGVIFLSRAGKGEMSRVLTSSAIAIVGLAFIAGAATLFFVGESLVSLLFK
jgi:hypothetical protein